MRVIYCCMFTFSSSSNLSCALMRCSKTLNRSLNITILWKNVSIGISLPAMFVSPGCKISLPPVHFEPRETCSGISDQRRKIPTKVFSISQLLIISSGDSTPSMISIWCSKRDTSFLPSSTKVIW